jgi:diguanylate cyclase
LPTQSGIRRVLIRYLLDFKTTSDVIVRTMILSLVVALMAAAATQQSYRVLLPQYFGDIGGKAYLIAFGLALLLAVPIIGVFFAGGLEINRLNMRLEALAQEDSLTGLMNRRKFLETVSAARSAESAELVMRSRGALLIVDADHFKRINDEHGHQTGDEALIYIADALRQSVRADDVVARLGGEEFGVFLHDADEHMAIEVAERIRTTICSAPAQIMGVSINISASIGGTEALRSQSLSDCMRNADIMLYAAKEAGRNRSLFAAPARVAPFVKVAVADRRQRVSARA